MIGMTGAAMDAKVTSARESLRNVQAARDTVRKALETAMEVLEAGTKMTQAAAGHLARCKDRRDTVQRALSVRIAESLRAGQTAELRSEALDRAEQQLAKAGLQHE